MPTIRKPIFVKPLDFGTITSGNVASGYSAQHLYRHKSPGLVWRSAGNSNLWIRCDMLALREVDFCALLSANAQAGTTIRLRLGTTQAEVDGTAPYDSGALPFISPSITREDGLYHSHLEIGSVQICRWWRIDIGGHTGDFDAAMLVLGKRIEPSTYYDFGPEFGVDDLGAAEVGRWGVVEEEPGRIARSVSFTMSWLNETEFETKFRPLTEAIGQRGPLYVCFDPEANAYRQNRTYYGLLRKPPYARGSRKPGTYAIEFQLLSLV